MSKNTKADVPAKMSEDEKKWRAESDMHALIQAHHIRKDKPRHKAAVAHAKKMAEAMQAVAQQQPGTPADDETPAAGSPAGSMGATPSGGGTY